MPIISVRDNKIIDERGTQKKKKDRKGQGGTEAKWFCSAFKLGFLQLLCKSFFNF